MSWIDLDFPLAPFSVKPGTHVLLPGTSYVFYIEENRIQGPGIDITFDCLFDLSTFQIHQQILKQRILVCGETNLGYVSYVITNGELRFLKGKEVSHLFPPFLGLKKPQEILHLGDYKNRSIEKMRVKASLTEVFPLWFLLGQISSSSVGDIPPSFDWKDAFWRLMTDLFAPKKEGILELGYSYIRSLFIKETESSLYLLPNLPIEAHSGRMRVQLKGLTLSMEWSKKEIKKVRVDAVENRSFLLATSSFCAARLRRDLKEKGERIDLREPIRIEKGRSYFFDQFRR